ncbi:MaoC/PaaZ C-terminal domain-containing protein [Dictyobacter arantiisoli]|uniref:Enoyl-CoA hydratase n=1 Tax=Dictyobacter arantiisoli TaxID=2014874 RepID=A0A5A5T535_9CHLR|nr:MaoC/PaaZ C-terminal domain-containing protein [Dictyobacter arantiisoli]GCF06440.1 enoyl-CoA hydratase [Dictyobacter arantiisoli]
MQIGDIKKWKRTFTDEDVRLFGKVSRDMGTHHILPDEQGRVMVHGLLTATLPTKLSGELNFIAHDLSFEFIRPVFVGDTVHCMVTITHLEQVDNRTKVTAAVLCHNQYGKIVLRGHTAGIIREPQPMSVGLL